MSPAAEAPMSAEAAAPTTAPAKSLAKSSDNQISAETAVKPAIGTTPAVVVPSAQSTPALPIVAAAMPNIPASNAPSAPAVPDAEEAMYDAPSDASKQIDQAAAPLGKFSGAADDDYIQWRVRLEARLRASGLWVGPEALESAVPEILAALDGEAAKFAAEGDGKPRSIFQRLDDKYIPKRRKTTYAERFATDPTHFETFRNMLNDASSGEEDEDFKIEDAEEDESSDSDCEPLVPETSVPEIDDGYVSADDEDYKVDDSKLVEDELDEEMEEKNAVPEEKNAVPEEKDAVAEEKVAVTEQKML